MIAFTRARHHFAVKPKQTAFLPEEDVRLFIRVRADTRCPSADGNLLQGMLCNWFLTDALRLTWLLLSLQWVNALRHLSLCTVQQNEQNIHQLIIQNVFSRKEMSSFQYPAASHLEEQYHFLCHSAHGLSHLTRQKGGRAGGGHSGQSFPVMFLLASADGFPQPLHCPGGHLALATRVNNSCL